MLFVIIATTNFFFFVNRINPEKITDIQKRMQAFLAQDQELKEKAQRVSSHLQLLEACQLNRTAVRIIGLQE